MPVLLEPDALNRDSLREAIGPATATVGTFDELTGFLRDRPDCKAVILGSSIDLDRALDFAERARATNPTMGVLLVRRRTDAAVLAQASRSGIREVVAERDLTGLTEAVRRSMDLTSALRRQGDLPAEAPSAQRGRMLTVFSPKGGAGKTTLAVNMGVLLARQGYRTLLLDLDLAFGDVPISLGMRPEHTFEELVAMGERLDAAALEQLVTPHESGLHVLAPPTDPGVHEQVSSALMRRLIQVALPEYDYIIADTAPSLDERAIIIMEASELVFLVTTLDIPSLKNLKIAIETLRLVAFPVDRLRVVMNRADSKVGLEPREVAKALGIPVVANIPSSRLVPSSTNRGVPVVTDQARSTVAQAIGDLVSEQLTGQPPDAHKRTGLRLRRTR